MNFPLFSIDKNKLVSLTGETSFLFKLTPPDLEQMENKDHSFEDLEKALIHNESNWMKLYSLDDKFWLNGQHPPELTLAEVKDEKKPLSLLFSGLDSNIEFFEDYFVYNGMFHRILSLKDFLPQINVNDLEGIDFCLNLKRLKAHDAKKKLSLKRKLHYSSLFKGIRDIESENAYSETEDLLENVVRGDESLFIAELFFIQKAQTKAELDDKTEILLEYIKSLSGKAFIEARGLQYFFCSIVAWG